MSTMGAVDKVGLEAVARTRAAIATLGLSLVITSLVSFGFCRHSPAPSSAGIGIHAPAE